MATFTVSLDSAIKIALERGEMFNRDSALWVDAISAYIEYVDESDEDFDIEGVADNFVINLANQYTWEEFEEHYGYTKDQIEEFNSFGGIIWAYDDENIIFSA